MQALRAFYSQMFHLFFLRALKRVKNENIGKNRHILTLCRGVAYPYVSQDLSYLNNEVSQTIIHTGVQRSFDKVRTLNNFWRNFVISQASS